LLYKDGTGGCDGCLNYEGMGVVNDITKKAYYAEFNQTDNNNLDMTV